MAEQKLNETISDNLKRERRIKRFYMSALFFVLCIIPVGLSVYLDLLPANVMVTWLAVCVTGNTIIYLILRSNITQQFKDPSLTIPHMVFSIGLVLYLHIYAGPTRGGYLLALMLIFAFGCFKLKTIQLVWLSIATLLAYICTIPIIKRLEGAEFNAAVEIVIWTAFAVFVPSLAILTSSFNALRKQLTEANQQLLELNSLDELTGVKNRSCFNKQLEHNLRRSKRVNNTISLLMIDIDHFKSINDTYGHLGGDTCLKQVANIIKESARRLTDDAFRFGGEEFAVLLVSTDAMASEIIAEKIRKKVEGSAIYFNGQEISVTVSIGSATVTPTDSQNYESETLIAQADKALYRAKETGRNKVCKFTNDI